MNRPWELDPAAGFARRLGKTARELGNSRETPDCPDIRQLSNGDVAIVGRDATDAYASRLPADMSIGADERLVVIPGDMFRAATRDVTDA